MPVATRIFVLALFLFAIPTSAADPPTGTRRALLVGVTAYPNLAAKFQLQGPANDVVLMRQVLTKHFQFADANVVTLSEAAGAKDAAKLPTRANIEREFQQLAAAVTEKDTVFILMGGHGSQQPENNRPTAEPEPDGLDEIFLPRDVGAWDDKIGSVANAIADDDLGGWLKTIRDKGASVCIVLDSCHSGTMTRGAGGEQLRQLDATNDLGIPGTKVQKARQVAGDREAAKGGEKTRGGGPAVEPPPFKLADKGGLVAIYAAQPSEPTAECELPPRDPNAQRYGLLTFSVCTALTKGRESSAKPMTYRELAQRVGQQYKGWGRTFPTPAIEGGDRDREFLGDKVWPGRSSYTLATVRGDKPGLRVNAGSLAGVTRDSILAVYPAPGKGEQLLGHVRVTDVRPAECDVEASEHDGKPLVADLPEGGVCKIVSVDYGNMKLRVAVDPLDDSGQTVAKDTLQRLNELVRGLSGPMSLIEYQAEPKRAEWLVRTMANGKILLVPASGTLTNSISNPAFGPVPNDGKLSEWLQSALERISRARNLLEIASRDDAPGGDSAPKLTIEVTINGKPAAWPSPDAVLYGGDKVRMKIVNSGRIGIDLTVLVLDSSYGIDCAFPNKAKNEFNRFKPGDKHEFGFTANSKSLGQEQLLIVAVKADGPLVDFAGLEQPSLDRFRDVTPGTRGKATALKGLLQKAAYGEGTRGLTLDEDDVGHVMKVVPWTTKPGNRPAENK